ncbi:MAG: c-type cytochrome [Planctomycetales bacterium]
MRMLRPTLLAVLFFMPAAIIIPEPLPAQDDFDEFPPGVVGRYAPGRAAYRAEPDVAFDWRNFAPDQSVPEGTFLADWSGLLLIRQAGKHTFHAHVQGQVTVEIDGKVVLADSRNEASWISGKPVELDFGERKLTIHLRKTAENASLKLYWSSDGFALEPVPAHLLFREAPDEAISKHETGRAQFAAARCNRCHVRENEPLAPAAPSLAHVAAGFSTADLIARIQDPAKTTAHARMPEFGFSDDEARAIAAYLTSKSRPVELEKIPKTRTSDRKQRSGMSGETLFHSLGCLACHTSGDLGKSPAFGGGDLADVGRRRSAEWLHTWLAKPEKLNPDHHMPVFQLSDDERRQLTLYLAGLKNESRVGSAHQATPDGAAGGERRAAPRVDEQSNSSRRDDGGHSPPYAEIAARGKALVAAARCAACHTIGDAKPDLAGLSDLSQPPADWAESCLAEKPDAAKRRPSYRGLDREAIVAYVTSRSGKLARENPFAQGLRVLEQRNCLACHDRLQSRGMTAIAGRVERVDEDLKGRSQALIPPSLTAVGDKLTDAALVEAVQGKQKPRMTWLDVRMPRFEHSEADLAALAGYLIAHDRIPAGAPASGGRQPPGGSDSPRGSGAQANDAPSASNPPAGLRRPLAGAIDEFDDSQVLVAGHTLVGPRGFSCVACHQIGGYVPKNTAIGTRGSDLLMLGKRMRAEYFDRWTRSPLRIVPGMEMPSYEKPVPGVLDGTLETQLAAMWRALNDTRFEPPTNPAAVEQFVVVAPGERPRIIRDMFQVGKTRIPRAFAVGFDNGHSFVYDLDTFAVRHWAFGDFARQQTVGKTWYWELAGQTVAEGFDDTPDFALRKKGKKDAPLIRPLMRNGTSGRLKGYRTMTGAVELDYVVDFEVDGKVRSVEINDRLTTTTPFPPQATTGTGWVRNLSSPGIPEGFELWIRLREVKPLLGQAEIDYAGIRALGPTVVRVSDSGAGYGSISDNITTVVYYITSLAPPRAVPKFEPPQPNLKKDITTVPGFDAVQLPLDGSIMPTFLNWTSDGTLVFTSLKGHVYLARDTDGDGLEDALTLVEEGLAVPWGVISDGKDLIVSHKPEILRLKDTDGDGRADVRELVATGWGYHDNYHDWTCGLVRDSKGNLFVGLGSDYSQQGRPAEVSLWRGKVLKIRPNGTVIPFAHSFRYPMGIAIDSKDRVFVSDQQGEGKPFNEINHVVEGRHYGLPSLHEKDRDVPKTQPAVKVPHDWTRSVNGLCTVPERPALAEFAGHGLGCEYNGRFLIRYTIDEVDGELQGAVYPFSDPTAGPHDDNFIGPLSVGVAPNGDIYVGCIRDSGWTGGPNVGAIVRLRAKPEAERPVGIREIKATPDGFIVSFTAPVDPPAAAKVESYTIGAYTKVYEGGYGAPDSGQHRVKVEKVEVAADARSVRLTVDRLRPTFVYDLAIGKIGPEGKESLWPNTGHYSMNRVPKAKQ